MDPGWTEWINVFFRFAHVVAGIMWIGNSLLFTWMELNLIPAEKSRDAEKKNDPDLLGSLDMLHGGGVFHLEKRQLRREAMPEKLHWFKWQSYTTWMTGFVLLAALFYSNGSTLVDATRTELTGGGAVLLSLAGIIGGWFVYDAIWRSPLKQTPAIGIGLSLIFLAGASILYGQYFNGRALYLQIGAMMGTCMSANVFFHIISNQHKFMRTLDEGKPHNLELGKRAKMRSMHNHYMTFPVIFLMLSAHFPRLYASAWNVPILLVIVLALMGVKHWMNSRYHFRQWLAALVGTVVIASVLVGLLLHVPAKISSTTAGSDPAMEAGLAVLNARGCAACHMPGTGQIAPALDGLFGKTRELADGSAVIADEKYIRESILQPHVKIVKGYAPAMPSYAGIISDAELADVISYLRASVGPVVSDRIKGFF